jgi:hypothetical protein
MRKLITVAMIAGAALAVSACKRQPAVNNVTANDLSANMSMTAPANDASAVESVRNSAPAATNNMSNSSANNSVADPGRGVSTNNVESNTVGM